MDSEVPSTSMLAPLGVGDRLPWKLSSDGEPLWLIVAGPASGPTTVSD